MRSYRVKWEIIVLGEDATDAAQKAVLVMQKESSSKTMLMVQPDLSTNNVWDLVEAGPDVQDSEY